MIIVDAHEDLAYNALADGRNYLQSALVTRAAEIGGPVPEANGQCTIGLPEWLQGGVAVVIATIFTLPRAAAKAGEMSYPNPEAAYQQAVAQLNLYRQWAAVHPQIMLVTRRPELERVLDSWTLANGDSTLETDVGRRQVGLVLLMENADPIRQVEELDWWYEQGLRFIGPAWNVGNRYTGGNVEPGPLTDLGRALLARMERHNMVLDLTHMADEASVEALERYGGPIVATHIGLRRQVAMTRMLPDEFVREIAARDGVVGIMPANWALYPNWKQPKTKAGISVDAVAETIDLVCQLTGDPWHVGIGTDFDGGFGAEETPAGIDTVADLPQIANALTGLGYNQAAIEPIMAGNWLRVLRQALPE
jgi:membrane dipeptidase